MYIYNTHKYTHTYVYIYNTYTYTRQLLILPMHTIGSSALQWAEGPRRPKFVKLTEMSSFYYVVYSNTSVYSS